jgi:hypothetical protein
MDESAAGQSLFGCENQELACDDIFDMLSNQRRRYTLYYLQQSGTPATIGTIATQVAAWERGKSREDVTADERKRVYTSLQQFHLPKLDEKRIVEFDEMTGAVELGAAAEEVELYLGEQGEADIPWGVYYLGLAAIGTTLVSLAWLDIAPFDAVPNSVWIAAFLTVLALSALSQTVLTHRLQLLPGDSLSELRR